MSRVSNLVAALFGLTSVISLTWLAATAVQPAETTAAFTPRQTRSTEQAVDGLGLQPYTTLVRSERAQQAWQAELDRQAAARAQAKARSAPTSPTISGSCAEMKPAGFPDYIIWRESRGNPTARNPSGAFGCAQIMPFHFSRGQCVGLDYKACWAKLYANNGLQPWAMTR